MTGVFGLAKMVSMMNTHEQVTLQTRLRTRIEDCDTDEHGEMRLIPIGMIGCVVNWDGELYDIEWENGGVTRWSPDEVLMDADIMVTED